LDPYFTPASAGAAAVALQKQIHSMHWFRKIQRMPLLALLQIAPLGG
jgi:hypothetical protein